MGLFGRKGHRSRDPRARLEAVGRLRDQDTLVELACSDDSPRVRMAALERVEGDDRLARIAKDAAELDVRLAAVERISSQQLLADIIKARKNHQLMGACFARITDHGVLTSIAEDPDHSPTARRIAVDAFADVSYLSDLDGDGPGERDDRQPGEPDVDALMQAYGDVRVVRAIGRFRRSEKALRALGKIARRGGEPAAIAVDMLCRALASSNPEVRHRAGRELAKVDDPDLVAFLVRALDDPKLHAPIQAVLEKIDTPQARDALGRGGAPSGS